MKRLNVIILLSLFANLVMISCSSSPKEIKFFEIKSGSSVSNSEKYQYTNEYNNNLYSFGNKIIVSSNDILEIKVKNNSKYEISFQVFLSKKAKNNLSGYTSSNTNGFIVCTIDNKPVAFTFIREPMFVNSIVIPLNKKKYPNAKLLIKSIYVNKNYDVKIGKTGTKTGKKSEIHSETKQDSSSNIDENTK